MAADLVSGGRQPGDQLRLVARDLAGGEKSGALVARRAFQHLENARNAVAGARRFGALRHAHFERGGLLVVFQVDGQKAAGRLHVIGS